MAGAQLAPAARVGQMRDMIGCFLAPGGNGMISTLFTYGALGATRPVTVAEAERRRPIEPPRQAAPVLRPVRL